MLQASNMVCWAKKTSGSSEAGSLQVDMARCDLKKQTYDDFWAQAGQQVLQGAVLLVQHT